MDTVSYLLGKKSAGGGGGGTSNYNDLSNKPSINGVTLSGNKTSEDLGITAETATITIDMQDRLREETLQKVGEFITENVGKVAYINVVDGSLFMSTGYIYIQNTTRNYTPATTEMTVYGASLSTAYIQGTWSNDEYTVESITVAELATSKGLSITNTVAYTPTQATHPATKGYVDGLIGNINEILATLATPSNGGE